jgi:hypothetical protein
MEGGITDSDRATLVRAAVARVGRDEMKTALARTNDPSFQAPKAVINALNALRKHRDPADVVTKPPYRAALPYVAAIVADDCLTRTIEVLGEHSDEPTRDQLLAALQKIGDSFSAVTVAVMLASVADSQMPASDLCFELATTDETYGLTGWATEEVADAPTAGNRSTREVTPEQREARRAKKQRDAEARRKKLEAARRAGEQVRRARKTERSGGVGGPGGGPGPEGGPGPDGGASGSRADGRGVTVAPHLTRRAALTPVQEEEFDRDDPWVAAVVFVWVPFDSVDPDQPELDGKSRRCVVVAGSSTELLVRAGFSEGGMKSRDWKSVPLDHWKQAGFDQPTWIESELRQVPRPTEGGPVGWLSPEDWNALW